jgi:hypothetical protein
MVYELPRFPAMAARQIYDKSSRRPFNFFHEPRFNRLSLNNKKAGLFIISITCREKLFTWNNLPPFGKNRQ